MHIPDPDIVQQPHVAVPLADVAPGWRHPELGVTLSEIANSLRYTDRELHKKMDTQIAMIRMDSHYADRY